MALLGIVQNDIKRVVAYSTLSQLGYMTVALGVSAYSAAIFHLMTHAFFKALLFLGAGSVIIAMHHEQDMRKMGGLRKYMPITYVDDAGRLAGAVRHSAVRRLLLEGRDHRGRPRVDDPGPRLRVLRGAWRACSSPSFYSFRMMFLAFHGKPRFDTAAGAPRRGARARRRTTSHEPPRRAAEGKPVGGHAAADRAGDPVGDRRLARHRADAGRQLLRQLDRRRSRSTRRWRRSGRNGTASARSSQHGVLSLPFWLALAGIVATWYLYLVNPALPERLKQRRGLALHAARQQVLLRPLQRLVLRRRRPLARRVPVERRRPAGSSTASSSTARRGSSAGPRRCCATCRPATSTTTPSP